MTKEHQKQHLKNKSKWNTFINMVLHLYNDSYVRKKKKKKKWIAYEIDIW